MSAECQPFPEENSQTDHKHFGSEDRLRRKGVKREDETDGSVKGRSETKEKVQDMEAQSERTEG